MKLKHRDLSCPKLYNGEGIGNPLQCSCLKKGKT